jgi:hypothetical protein
MGVAPKMRVTRVHFSQVPLLALQENEKRGTANHELWWSLVANSRSSGREIADLLRNPKFHYHLVRHDAMSIESTPRPILILSSYTCLYLRTAFWTFFSSSSCVLHFPSISSPFICKALKRKYYASLCKSPLSYFPICTYSPQPRFH